MQEREPRSYLDHNATSGLRPEAAQAVARALDLPGNPSSIHAEGRAARAVIEAAREQVAPLVGASPKQVVFTSGGTEASATVLSPGLRRVGGKDATLLLVGAAEHPCVLSGHRFPAAAVEHIPVDRDGIVDLAWLDRRLADAAGPVLVSIQAANNETGVLQPVAAASHLVKARGGLMHTDAVQAAGKVPLDMAALGVDALTLSAHKFGGPKGVGAIILASDGVEMSDRLLRGGGQERGSRAGTENVAAIAGFGAAAEAVRRGLEGEAVRIAGMKSDLEGEIRRIAPDAVIFAAGAPRLPNTVAFAVPGLRAETALIAFDLAGVAVSSGSACSSGKVKRSHVLQAMGVEPALAEGAIRVSLGWNTAAEDVFRFARACETVVRSLYQRRANAA
jgi:cysteine desulfurase